MLAHAILLIEGVIATGETLAEVTPNDGPDSGNWLLWLWAFLGPMLGVCVGAVLVQSKNAEAPKPRVPFDLAAFLKPLDKAIRDSGSGGGNWREVPAKALAIIEARDRCALNFVKICGAFQQHFEDLCKVLDIKDRPTIAVIDGWLTGEKWSDRIGAIRNQMDVLHDAWPAKKLILEAGLKAALDDLKKKPPPAPKPPPPPAPPPK